MTQTKQEIRDAWSKENMRKYGVAVHKENERHIVDYIEEKRRQGAPISATFKAGIEKLIEDEEGK